MVTKEPKPTTEEIRGELQGQGTSVTDRTTRRCMSQRGEEDVAVESES